VVRISAGTSVIVAEIIRGFPLSPQPDDVIRSRPHPSRSISIHHSSIAPPSVAAGSIREKPRRKMEVPQLSAARSLREHKTGTPCAGLSA
jgi:hypothetical protein